MLQAVPNALRLPDLRRKLLITFSLLVVFRFVAHIPVPVVDVLALRRLFAGSELLQILNLFSGGALENFSVAALGVYPYITASIILQVLTPMVPQLQALSKEGEMGRHKINQYTHWLTVPLAVGQGWGQLFLLSSAGVVRHFGFTGADLLPTLATLVSLAAGTMFGVWLGELITEHGIGNGVSVIIFGGIVAGLPSMFGQSLSAGGANVNGLILFAILGLGIVFAIVLFQEAQRRIPVQYAKSIFRGGRMYRQGGTTHIPLRVNSAGMIPLIFAITIVILPSQLFAPFTSVEPGWLGAMARFVVALFDPNGLLYWGLYFLLVVGFTFFYTLVIFQNQNLAENLQKHGGFIPGIRPGRPTGEYLIRVLTRITWGGALFLGMVAVTPFFAQKLTSFQALQISSTALLIVVGVVLDTMRQLEAQLLMRQYEGFIR